MKRFEARDGKIYVVDHFPMCDEPTMIVCCYPTEIRESDYPEIIGQEAEHAGPGVYVPMAGYYDPPRFALINRGKTLPDPQYSELQPIPCPKVRKGIRTRYIGGRWERLLKSVGWVAI